MEAAWFKNNTFKSFVDEYYTIVTLTFVGEGPVLGGCGCRGVDWDSPCPSHVTESQTGHRGDSDCH